MLRKYFKLLSIVMISLVISTGMIYLVFYLGSYTKSINELEKDYDSNSVFVYLPSEEQKSYVFDNYDNAIELYANIETKIDEITYNTIAVVSSYPKEIFVYDQRIMRYHSNDFENLDNQVYQSTRFIENVKIHELKSNRLIFESKVEYPFLFKKASLTEIKTSDIYLIKINMDSAIYQNFVSKFGLPKGDIHDDGYYLNGTQLFKATTSIVSSFDKFIYILFLLPIILYILLYLNVYRFFLSKEIINFKTKHIFYARKRDLVLKEFIYNAIIFTLVYAITSLIYSIFAGMNSSIILYLLITAFIIILVILYVSYKIVNDAIKEYKIKGGI